MNSILGEHKCSRRFGNLPYIRLWLLCIVTTPFILHYTELLKAYSTVSCCLSNLLSRGNLNDLNWLNPISNLCQSNSLDNFL